MNEITKIMEVIKLIIKMGPFKNQCKRSDGQSSDGITIDDENITIHSMVETGDGEDVCSGETKLKAHR